MDRIGIIGTGNMGSAIAEGLIAKNREIIVSDANEENLKYLAKFENVLTTTNNLEVVEKSKYVILAVKPNIYPRVIDEIKNYLGDEKIVITIAAGQNLKKLNDQMPNKKIVMTMPNTPALVQEGMSAICPNENVSKEEVEEVLEIFNSFGRASLIEEYQFDSFQAACSCLPAYVYMFIEAVSDGAVLHGMKRQDSYEFIAQAVMGTAKMVLETKKHPGELKDMVTSPGGTTIEGLKVLEESGFRGAIIDAISAAVEKSKNM